MRKKTSTADQGNGAASAGVGPDAAVTFLEWLRPPRGPWVLTAILPDKVPSKPTTITITAHTADDVRAFITAHDGTRNIYYSVNRLRGAMAKKAAKTDIAAVDALADLDPRDDETAAAAKARYTAALGDFTPQPSAVINSGNGIQLLWRLREPIALGEPVNGNGKPALSAEDAARIADIEPRIAAAMERLGSVAGTQNIDRIMRLPGTTNLPNKPKRDAGRTVCPTSLISFSATTCDLSDFPLPSAGEQASDDATPAAPVAIDWAKVEEHAGWLTGVEALPADFRPKGRMIVAHRGNIKELNADLIDAGLLAKGYSSWSDVTLALTAVLKADARYTTEKIAAALMCDLPCNRHVFKQDTVDDKRRAVWRAIGTARTATRVAQALAWRETKANGFPVAESFQHRAGGCGPGHRVQ